MRWSTPEVKQFNKEQVRQEIQRSGKSTKAAISRKTSLSVATCNTAFNEMLKDGEILQVEQEEIHTGRPASQYIYNPDYQHVLGMYIHTKGEELIAEYATADSLGNPITRRQLLPKQVDYDFIQTQIEESIQKDPLIRGISLGLPCVIAGGVIEYCDIESLVGINIETRLEERFQMEVEIRNDMDFISYGVYNSLSRKNDNMAIMYFPVGSDSYVGCGFVIDGKVLRGFTKFAGELSYIAEGFGISRQEQLAALQDRERFCSLAAKMVLVVISTIDPEELVLMGNEITDSEAQVIRQSCKQIVSEKHIPKLMVENNIEEHYICGLIRTALNKLQFPLSRPV